jgi:WhiB family redox-sensing transcriptional regulator
MNARDELKFANEGACVGLDPEAWFPDRRSMGRIKKTHWRNTHEGKIVEATCGSCPVASACLEYALKFHDIRGIWGGLDEKQREAIQRNARMTNLRSVLGGEFARYYREWMVSHGR